MPEHISFSELKEWADCPYFHKLKRIDKLSKFAGNIFTAFGKAIHTINEYHLLNEDCEAKFVIFDEEFKKELLLLENKPEIKEIEQFSAQARPIIRDILPAMHKYFGDFEVIAAEHALYELIPEELSKKEFYFKGFIDLIIKTKDKIVICDYKSCTYGWDRTKKNSKILQYQLLLYKYFYARKFGLDLKNIDTCFILLKRTAKKDNAEVFRVTSGNIKMESCLKLLKNCLTNLDKGFAPKNRMACKYCEFYNTEHCKK